MVTPRSGENARQPALHRRSVTVRLAALIAPMLLAFGMGALMTIPTDIKVHATGFTDSMILVPTAQKTATGLQLTSAEQLRAGAAWVTDKQSLTSDIHAQFVFSFHDSNTLPHPADGLAFVIQNDLRGTDALGEDGGGLGYGGISPSVAVEFDDYYNGGADPTKVDPLNPPNQVGDANHVGVDTDGLMTSKSSVDPPFPLYGSGSTYAWVDYNATFFPHTVSVSVSQDNVKPAPLLTYPIDLSIEVGSTMGYVGLTAATGASDQITDVTDFTLNPSAPPPTSVLSTAGYLLNGQPNQALSNLVVAKVDDSDVAGTASDYLANIDWGDGSPTTSGNLSCTIISVGGSSLSVTCSVSGSHSYSTRGAFVVTVSITKINGLGAGQTATARSEAEITQFPSGTDINRSVGELVAFDEPVPSATTPFAPCTATALLSVTQDVIVAAAHCFADILNHHDGHTFRNFKFAPFHHGPTCAALEMCGKNPFGVFSSTAASVTLLPGGGPTVQNEQRFDWGFLRLAPLAGRKLDEVVPGLAVQFNSSTESNWAVLGYPTGKQIGPATSALSKVICVGSSTTYTGDGSAGPPGPPQLLIASKGCNAMTNGASGGPWLLISSGRVGVVNKACCPLLGTYLGDEAQQAYLNASLR